MTITLNANTPLAEALGAAVQPKLVEMGWSVEGEESSPLAEYIIVMLVNGKTEEQINAELTGDLLGLGPEDESAKEFTRWLFEELQRLAERHGASSPSTTEPNANLVDRSEANGESSHGDDFMQDVGSQQGDAVPTGPRAMRHNNNNNNSSNYNSNNSNNSRDQRGGRRPGGIFQQLNRAMERPPNDPLRRVRPQGDSTRIMKYDQNGRPIMGGSSPRANQLGRNQQGQRMQQNVQSAFGMPPQMGGPQQQPNAFGPVMMSPEQQMQFFQMMEQQARMLGMPGFMPIMGQGAFPNGQQPGQFPNGPQGPQGQQGQGRSMFERVHMPHDQKNRGNGNNDAKPAGHSEDTIDGTSQSGIRKGEDGEEISKDQIACKFALSCTKADCPFAHPSPVSDPSRASSFVPGEKCHFGINCKNRKCTQSHPSPAGAPNAPSVAPTKNSAATVDCRFYPNCTNPVCPYRHPMPPCRNGPSCTRPGCHFSHEPTEVPCKFRPCLNPTCSFKHEEGQQGSFDNKVWTSDGTGRPHLSERRFVTDDQGEELIIPGHSTATDADLLQVEHDMEL